MPAVHLQALNYIQVKSQDKKAPETMANCIVRKLDFVKKLPLSASRCSIMAAIAMFGFVVQTQAQSPTTNEGQYVAIIKSSTRNRPGKAVGFRDGHYVTRNTNVDDLIALAYGLHAKQIIGGPEWLGTDLYDIEVKPDADGLQVKTILQRLLAQRFNLTFHHGKRELLVYVISVASGGPKMTGSDPNGRTAFSLRGPGDLLVTNMTITDFAIWMQAGVMDKPVVDQTGLSGSYDFQLKWTPDESQFNQFRGTGAVVPPPTDDPNAPPSLYKAIQEQLGLRLRTANLSHDVIVIDSVEKPSEQ